MDTPDWNLDDATLRRAHTAKWTYPADDVLPAWVAEMDVTMSALVRQALDDALDRGMVGYPPDDTSSGLPEATAAFMAGRFGWAADPAHVVACADVMAGIRFVLDQLCEPAPVVVPVPSYPPFLAVVPLTGRRLITVPCVPAADGRDVQVLDLEAIESALLAGARTILISSPYNPLGRVFSRGELEALRDLAVRHGARVISDEIHAPLVLPGATHIPYASLDGTEEHAVTVTAASKSWNLPGLKCAQVIASNGTDAAALRHPASHLANFGVSTMGIVAAIAAYTEGEQWLDAVITHLAGQRERFGCLLAEHVPSARWTPVEATYLAWVDARDTPAVAAQRRAGPEGRTVDGNAAGIALSRGKLMLHNGAAFSTDPDAYAGFARVNLATSTERLDRIVERLGQAWN